MKLGAHCVLYGEKIKTDTDYVLSALSEAGAAGCELGLRFFDISEKDKLVTALETSGMELAAINAGAIDLMDLLNAPEKAYDQLKRAAIFVKDLPNRNVLFSACPLPYDSLFHNPLERVPVQEELRDLQKVKTLAKNLDKIAVDIMEKYGVQIHSHNHNFEFANNALIFRSFAQYAPNVTFALDCGWAFASGYDPADLLDQYPGRFHYLHLRDCKKVPFPEKRTYLELNNSYKVLGCGDINYPKLISKAQKQMGENDWLIVEFETSNFTQLDYAKSLGYIKGIQATL